MNRRHVAERLAKEATRQIAIRWGDSFPFYYVSEYPKSGGTWVANMVSDYLQLPFPRFTIMPVGTRAVIQNHWRYHPGLHRVFYVYRDGRDVMVSYFFDRLRVAQNANASEAARVRGIYERVLGVGYDAEDATRLLPDFMRFEFTQPGRGARVNWSQHVLEWHNRADRTNVVFLSYENLRSDPAGTLGAALKEITGDPVDDWRLEHAVDKFSFRRITGREPGESDPTQHARKGIVGDWKSYFTREAAEVFDAHAGEALVRLGYEPDRSWVDRYEYVSP